MNIRLRYRIGAAVAVLLGIFLYGRYGKSKPVVPNVLPPGDTGQITVDPIHHSLIVVGPHGTHTINLPDHPSVIDIHPDGTTKVTASQYGFQVRPFAGAYYSDALLFGGGVDLGYWMKLDLGIGLAGGASAHTVAFAQLTYCIWDNVGASLTYDHMGHIGGGITVRL